MTRRLAVATLADDLLHIDYHDMPPRQLAQMLHERGWQKEGT